MITATQLATLKERALANRDKAYCPYSNFRVGCCLLADGKFYDGANVENASYGGAICAERTATVVAVSQGVRQFDAVAIAADLDETISPCGICRQVLREFAVVDMPIYMYSKDGSQELVMSMGELLPESFGPDQMGYWVDKNVEEGSPVQEKHCREQTLGPCGLWPKLRRIGGDHRGIRDGLESINEEDEHNDCLTNVSVELGVHCRDGGETDEGEEETRGGIEEQRSATSEVDQNGSCNCNQEVEQLNTRVQQGLFPGGSDTDRCQNTAQVPGDNSLSVPRKGNTEETRNKQTFAVSRCGDERFPRGNVVGTQRLDTGYHPGAQNGSEIINSVVSSREFSTSGWVGDFRDPHRSGIVAREGESHKDSRHDVGSWVFGGSSQNRTNPNTQHGHVDHNFSPKSVTDPGDEENGTTGTNKRRSRDESEPGTCWVVHERKPGRDILN
ncbi:hypothetical protein OGAPHI_000545 [Ogataea philodendri]|uniref:cytidine deaminase n=1 Tax=Ogataea philodendri TaxID=1378263 RepID=A0A9P8PHE6_9ASCO|nr:uncharacterized protein OGAPHI_000545 [Ogataea philodendri]KAH3671322.1 hypothetical protein OGAPHI_000545 [Ogataea philodendri]